MKQPIWKTPEAKAWCRGFKYTEYVYIVCIPEGVNPVPEEMYQALCICFEDEMERTIGVEQDEDDLWLMKKDEV